MISTAVSFCMIAAFSLAVTRVLCWPVEDTRSYITVSAKNPSRGDLLADHEWRRFFSVTPIRDEQKDQEVQKLNQQYFRNNVATISKRVLQFDNIKDHVEKQTATPAKPSKNTIRKIQQVNVNVDKVEDIQKVGSEDKEYSAYPKYEFKYGVDDPHTGDRKYQQEKRVGDKVIGEFSYVLPNGRILSVTYKADGHNGFYAVVDRGDKDNYGW